MKTSIPKNNQFVKLAAALLAFAIHLPRSSSAFSFGGADAGGLPQEESTIEGPAFRFSCQIYVVKNDGEEMGVKTAMLSNAENTFSTDRLEKFGKDTEGYPGERNFQQDSSVKAFSGSKNDQIVLVKSKEKSRFKLILRALDDSIRPVVVTTSVTYVDIESPFIRAELLTAQWSGGAIGIDCRKLP